jgi:sugar phosphate isomerase/epimerase
MFALSTVWNALQHSHAEEITEEIKSIGFKQIELNFNLTPVIVKEMIDLKDRGKINVVSIHNFCPIPKGISRYRASPDVFSISALDEVERQKAIYYTKKSIETASRIGAEAVIVHAGKIQMDEKIKELAELYIINKDKKRYHKLKAKMLKERQEKSKRFFNQALKSLEHLCCYAQKHNVKLGIENRYYLSEIPSLEEMETVLTTFPSPPLYYWHDIGHAQVYENLGFTEHKTILDKFSKRMLGVHFHDIEGINDHRAPLKGTFDFSLLRPYLKRKTIKVLEIHYPSTAKEIIAGIHYLERLFAG